MMFISLMIFVILQPCFKVQAVKSENDDKRRVEQAQKEVRHFPLLS